MIESKVCLIFLSETGKVKLLKPLEAVKERLDMTCIFVINKSEGNHPETIWELLARIIAENFSVSP